MTAVPHRRRLAHVALAAAFVVLGPSPASARGVDLFALAQEVRASGCDGRAGVASPLRRRAELDALARTIASGVSLRAALDGSDLAVMQADVLRIDGDPPENVARRMMVQRICGALLRAGSREAGLHARDGSAWLLVVELAPPASPGGRRDVVTRPLPPGSSGAARVSAAEVRGVLALVNEARSRPRRCGTREFAAAPPLQWSVALETAARVHARDMALRGFFEHRGSDGSSPSERLGRTGYRWALSGENLAYGPGTATEVVAGWLASPGHCANIMEPRFRELGVAVERAPPDQGGALYWAQTFALSRGAR